jgi:hypothetical protein
LIFLHPIFTLQLTILSTSGVAFRWWTQKVWYPYILGSCGVCCRNVLSIPEVSTCASPRCNHQPHFFFVKFHTNAKNANVIFCCMILDLLVKKSPNFEKLIIFFITFPLRFSRWDIFCTHFLLLGQVPETCHHLIVNPSWDACMWSNIRNFKKQTLLITMCFQFSMLNIYHPYGCHL